MNQDMYVEWLVKRKEPAYAWPARIGLAILCLISLFFALMVVWGILLGCRRRGHVFPVADAERGV